MTEGRPVAPRRFDLHRRVGLIAVGMAFVKGAQLVAAFVLVRLLSKDDWGRMALLLSIYQVAIGVGSLNIQQSVYFFFGKLAPGQRRGFAVQNALLLAAAGAVAALIVFGLSHLGIGGSFHIAPFLPWVALAVLIEIPTLGTAELLVASERVGLAVVFNVLSAAVQVASIALPLALGASLDDAVPWMLAHSLLRAAGFLAVLLLVLPSGRIRLGWARIRDQLVYIAPLGLTIATTLLNRNIDRWYVAALAARDFAAYSVASNEVPLISILPQATATVLAMRLVLAFGRGDRGQALALWQASTARMSLVVVPAALATVLCAPELARLLFTVTYADAGLPFQIFSLILLHRVAEYGVVLRAAGETSPLWRASFVLLASNAVLSLLGTLLFGMVGAALGVLFANALAWFYMLSRIARVMRVPFGRAFPWGLYLRLLALAAACGGLAAAAGSAFTSTAAVLAVKLLVFGASFLAALRATRLTRRLPAIPPDETAAPAAAGLN